MSSDLPSGKELNPDAKVFQPQGLSAVSPTGRSRVTSDGSTSGRNRKRTATLDGADQHTLVLKNLGSALSVEDLRAWLVEKGVPPNDDPNSAHLHTDSSGTFRGTAFVKYQSADAVQYALRALGPTAEMGGRKVKVELQRKGRDSRAGLEAELPQDLVNLVQEMITAFVASELNEVYLPSTFDTKMRKYAHSLAERSGLVHVTQASEKENGKKCVYLSKSRPEGRNKPRTESMGDGEAMTDYSMSPMSTFQPSPVLRAAHPGASPTYGRGPSASSPWAMPMDIPESVDAWYAQLGEARVVGPTGTRLNPNSPPFYPTQPPVGDITEMAALSLDGFDMPAAPDGTKGFRRQRTGGPDATPHAGQQSVLGALESLSGK